MAGQPAVELSLPFSVASYAKAHLKIDGDEPVLSFNVAVTLFAVDLVPTHMGLMTKKDIIRHEKDPDPGDGFLRLKVIQFLQNLRMLRDDVLMAEKTFLHRGKPRVLRTLHKGMTETAVDFFHTGMDAVAERNGLSRPDRSTWVSEHEIRHQGKEKGRKQEPEVLSPWSITPRTRFWLI